MFRLIPRLLLRPTTTAILAMAAAWGGWWVWPERPLSSFQKRGIGHPICVQVSPDGHFIHSYFIEMQGNLLRDDEPARIAALFRVPSGTDVIPKNQRYSDAAFLNDARVLLLGQENGVALVDLSAEKVFWETCENISFIRWARDGQVIVAKTGVPDHWVVIFDASSGKKTILPNADSPFAIDRDGRYVVSLLRDDRTAFALWSAADGRELKRFRSPTGAAISAIEMRSDGQQAATLVIANADGPDYYAMEVWNLCRDDSGTVNSSLLSGDYQNTPCFADGHYLPSPDVSLIWEIATDVAQAQKRIAWGLFDCSKQRYLDLSQPTEWKLHDANSHSEIARGRRDSMYGDGSMFSDTRFAPEGNWFIAARNHDLTKLDEVAIRILGQPFAPDNWYDIVSACDGHVIKRINTDESLAGLVAGNRLWTYRSEQVGDSDDYIVRFSEWSAEPSRPPRWLWSLTVAGVGFIGWRLRRNASATHR